MTYTKLLELENKFTKKLADNNDNARFHAQRDRLSKFFHKLTNELKAIISEMGGDIAALRLKEFDPKVLSVFASLREKLIELTKDIAPTNPYEGTNKLIEWSNDKNNKAILDNLKFIIQEYLKQNQADFEESSFLKRLSVRSLHKLSSLIKEAQKYIEENPMLPDPRNLSTIPPPALRNVRDEDGSVSIGPESETIPGAPASKKEKEAI